MLCQTAILQGSVVQKLQLISISLFSNSKFLSIDQSRTTTSSKGMISSRTSSVDSNKSNIGSSALLMLPLMPLCLCRFHVYGGSCHLGLAYSRTEPEPELKIHLYYYYWQVGTVLPDRDWKQRKKEDITLRVYQWYQITLFLRLMCHWLLFHLCCRCSCWHTHTSVISTGKQWRTKKKRRCCLRYDFRTS